MNAVILYDDYDLAVAAMGMLSRAVGCADETVQWAVKPWRLDMLIQPLAADAALEDAAEANLIVLAIRSQTDLPCWLLDWLEQWATRRQVQGAALAVWDGGNGRMLADPATHELAQLAGRHGLSFIYDNVRPVEDNATAFARRLHDRAEVMTPTLLKFQSAVERGYQQWGLNE